MIIQFLKFGIVGAINTVLSYAITNGAYYLLHMHEQMSNFIAFIITVFISFMLNGKFVFTENKEERDRYFLKPRILSSDIYGTTELYYIILRINNMWSPKQFTLENNKLKMLTKDHMNAFLTAIMRVDSKDIESYNSLHTN